VHSKNFNSNWFKQQSREAGSCGKGKKKRRKRRSRERGKLAEGAMWGQRKII
jgi:hypothetical protein